jgi:hypothetical protein
MTTELGGYDMDGVMLDLGSDVNILPKKSWEVMGKPKLVWLPIKLRLSNKYNIYPIGRLEQVEVNIEGVKTKSDFKFIEIMDDLDPYLAFIGINWDFDNNVLNLKSAKSHLRLTFCAWSHHCIHMKSTTTIIPSKRMHRAQPLKTSIRSRGTERITPTPPQMGN